MQLTLNVDASVIAGDNPAVIRSALLEMSAPLGNHFPLRVETINLEHGAPFTWYPQIGQPVRMSIAAQARNWEQQAFEFGHELCHVLARYGVRDGLIGSTTLWLEEGFCEAASLYTLHEMRRVWRNHLDPDRSGYIAMNGFNHLLDLEFSKPERQLPTNETASRWFARHRMRLRAYNRGVDPTVVQLGSLAGLQIFRLMERLGFHHWASLEQMNSTELHMPQYLRRWRDTVPQQHHVFIDELIQLFGLTIA